MTGTHRRRHVARAALCAVGIALTAVQVQAQENTQQEAAANTDPLEGFNRAVFGFNEGLDKVLIKPLAQGYRKVTPELVRRGVDNVFGNFSDVWSSINHLLQGKLEGGVGMGMRVMTNTVLGFGGVLDVASEVGLERQSEDFGQTLGVWGVGPGPYLVLPLFGSSNFRDTAALPLDTIVSPGLVVDDSGAQAGLQVLRVVSVRANLLNASQLIDGLALDKYVFVRDAYISRRNNLVYDGDPPSPPEDAEPAAVPAAPAPPAVPSAQIPPATSTTPTPADPPPAR